MPEPTKIPRPFADSGDKNSIPDSSGSIGFASWQEGFPAITSEPFASGGVAPKRADFNGIFNALSAATMWAQQGGVYAYDATTDYEIGNVVEYSGDLYQCLVANGPNSAVVDPTDSTVWGRFFTAADTQIERNVSNTTAYYRLSNGLQILTGSATSSSGGNATVNFDHAFSEYPRVFVIPYGTTAAIAVPKVSVDYTFFYFVCVNASSAYISQSVRWLAFGIGA